MNVFINNDDICVCFKLSHNWYPTGASSCIVFWPLALLTSLGLVGAPPCCSFDPCSGLCLLPWPPSLSQLFCVYRPRAPKGLSRWNWVFDAFAENSGFWPLWCQREGTAPPPPPTSQQAAFGRGVWMGVVHSSPAPFLLLRLPALSLFPLPPPLLSPHFSPSLHLSLSLSPSISLHL